MYRLMVWTAVAAISLASSWGGIADAAGGPASGKTPPASEYWIGVACAPITSPDCEAQLQLPNDEGLLAETVYPDSPAAKAGLQEGDVLLKAGSKTLSSSSFDDLVRTVDAARDKKLSVELIRGGQRSTVQVQPEKRPAELLGGGSPWPLLPGRRRPARKRCANFPSSSASWTSSSETAGPANWDRATGSFTSCGRATILPPGATIEMPPLSEGTTVIITKHGRAPAVITVEKDGHHWEVTEKGLDKLPAEIRPEVERLVHPLGGLPCSWAISTTASSRRGVRSPRPLSPRLRQWARRRTSRWRKKWTI